MDEVNSRPDQAAAGKEEPGSAAMIPVDLFAAFPAPVRSLPSAVPINRHKSYYLPLLLVAMALLVMILASRQNVSVVIPKGIDPVRETPDVRYEQAVKYVAHADELRAKGLAGWDDKSVLREALSEYRCAWSLLTGQEWFSRETYYGMGRDYKANDFSKPIITTTEARLLHEKLKQRIIEMEDAPDAIGWW
jgi:hypothetical protein